MTTNLPLVFHGGHLFVSVSGARWLVDTGAPQSFGGAGTLSLCGLEFPVGASYMGLTPEQLSGYVGVECEGLLGVDVLNTFDIVISCPENTMVVSTGELKHDGARVFLEEFMGVPLVTVRIGREAHRMALDTGAQVSYLQSAALKRFPKSGALTDFYPGLGRFSTDVYQVPVSLAGEEFVIRCGELPGLLGMTLGLAGASGILGNEWLRHRAIGYFPRRRLLCL